MGQWTDSNCKDSRFEEFQYGFGRGNRRRAAAQERRDDEDRWGNGARDNQHTLRPGRGGTVTVPDPKKAKEKGKLEREADAYLKDADRLEAQADKLEAQGKTSQARSLRRSAATAQKKAKEKVKAADRIKV